MVKKLILLLVVMILCVGCGKEKGNNIDNEPQTEYINSPIICEYTSSPAYGHELEFFDFCIRVMDDNKVEVYCTNFEDRIDGEEIKVENFYSETYEITEEQKQEIIDILEENDIKSLGDCSTDSCDGSYLHIYLFDENGEISYSCGGLNPSTKRFENTRQAIFELLPDGAYHTVTEKGQEALIEYLKENYSEEYDYLNEWK